MWKNPFGSFVWKKEQIMRRTQNWGKKAKKLLTLVENKKNFLRKYVIWCHTVENISVDTKYWLTIWSF